jgi:hypothetical protein
VRGRLKGRLGGILTVLFLVLIVVEAILDAISGDWALLVCLVAEIVGLVLLALVDIRYGLTRRERRWGYVIVGAFALVASLVVVVVQS